MSDTIMKKLINEINEKNFMYIIKCLIYRIEI